MRTPSVRVLACVLGPLLLGGCAALANLQADLDKVGIKPPTVTFQGATLVQSPSQKRLAAYYCPEVASVPLGGAGLLCQGFFGRRPGVTDMAVSFDLSFHVTNPNNIPLPLATVLTAATVFPAAGNQRLGAACVQLCPPGQAGCTGQAPAGACEASSRDVRSLGDFAAASARMLVASGVAVAGGQPIGFQAPQVSAASALDVVVRFTFGPDELLGTLRQLATQSARELQAGRTVSFAIPYGLEGTTWFDAGSFGRLAVGYGPFQGTWVLPTQDLVPR